MGKIREILPCIIDPNKFRVIGELEFKEDLRDTIKKLKSVIPNAICEKNGNWITFTMFGKLITIYHDGYVTITRVANEEEAIKILNNIEELIKKVNRGSYNSSKELNITNIKITPLDIYNLLPKLNCGICGETTCLAFAIKVFNNEKSIKLCKPLFSYQKFKFQKEQLLTLLKASGYLIDNLV